MFYILSSLNRVSNNLKSKVKNWSSHRLKFHLLNCRHSLSPFSFHYFTIGLSHKNFWTVSGQFMVCQLGKDKVDLKFLNGSISWMTAEKTGLSYKRCTFLRSLEAKDKKFLNVKKPLVSLSLLFTCEYSFSLQYTSMSNFYYQDFKIKERMHNCTQPWMNCHGSCWNSHECSYWVLFVV